LTPRYTLQVDDSIPWRSMERRLETQLSDAVSKDMSDYDESFHVSGENI